VCLHSLFWWGSSLFSLSSICHHKLFLQNCIPEQQQHWKVCWHLIFNEFLPSSFLWAQSVITNVFCKTVFQNNNIESVSTYYKRSWRRRIVF
jgi:hypothetical protein